MFGPSLQKVCPVSYAQKRLWLLDRLEPGDAAYNVARAIRMCGTLSAAALRESLQEIVARHESLRTTFAERDGEPVQIIAHTSRLDLSIVDLSHLRESERESQAVRVEREEAQTSFDLTLGPLIRAKLLRLSPFEHVLVLVMHHIITDAWSMGVFFEELGRLYEAFADRRPSPLTALSVQYSDFSRWQRESLTREVLDRKLVYWQHQLAGLDPVLELPAGRSRPSIRTSRGATERRVFPTALREGLKTISRETDATLFMTLLAAFQTLLWRYTGRDDLVVGSSTAGRTAVPLEPLVGFFVNPLPLRTNLSGNPTFRDLIHRVREVTLDAYAHQDVPFEALVEALDLRRSLSYTPLFQVMFILQNLPRRTFRLPGLTLEEIELDSETAKFDLAVEMAEVDDGLSCAFEYSRDLFERDTVRRMLDHFHCLLDGIVSDPDQRLSALPVLTAPEKCQLLFAWNDTAADYPRNSCIHELFEAQAVRTPETVALKCRDRFITYRELNSRANQLAHHLWRRGVGRGVLVGICIERSIEAAIGLLAVLKAGGAYVPMDPSCPAQRLAFMLEDSQAPVVLTMQHLLGRLPRCDAEPVCLDREGQIIAAERSANPEPAVSAVDLAYVMYTSGSTGTPKGVLATHRASVNRFCWMWDRWPFTRADICCQKTPLSFVDSVWEIFGPLLRGVPNVIIPDEAIEDPTRLVRVLQANRITRIVLVPSLLRLLLDSTEDLKDKLPDLRFWVTSGEAITPELTQHFEEVLPGATLVNLYGSSEVAGDVTSYVIRNSSSLQCIPIGRPIANTRVYLLDRYLNLVPIGVSGEICIGGDPLARGYLHRREQTSEKFIFDPFRTEDEARLYRTGDVGRFMPDGNLEYLGRADNQVKIRGIRVELGEIEGVLRTHPAIDAVAVSVAGTDGRERLIAHVVVSDGTMAPDDLRHFVAEKLPNYMVPAAFVIVDSLPLLPNGKVDRRALSALDGAASSLDREYRPPGNPVEEALAEIMGEVLRIERVGIHDDFFELGGHSLLAVQFVARVRRKLHVELPLRTVFQHPTVAQLSPEIAKAETSHDVMT